MIYIISTLSFVVGFVLGIIVSRILKNKKEEKRIDIIKSKLNLIDSTMRELKYIIQGD